MPVGLVRIALSVPAAAADAFEAALAEIAPTVSRFEESGLVRVEGLLSGEPDLADLGPALSLAAAATGVAAPRLAVEAVGERDWAAASRASFPPFRLGCFLVHPSDQAAPAPAGTVPLAVDAGLAFGSGRHGSTAGCLLALDGLRRRSVRKPIDVGCGSGILAIALARLWRARVLASDVDPAAVAVARANAEANGVGARVRTIAAEGLRSREILRAAPFDLMTANILAPPLRRMASDVTDLLAPGGRLVLSGFLEEEGNAVLAAYRARGLRPVRRVVVDGWLTLVLAR